MISEDSTLGGYPEGGGRLDAKSSKPDYGNGGHGDGGWRRHQHQSRRAETARVRKRKERERVDVKLPVVFNRDLAPGHAAFLLAEVRLWDCVCCLQGYMTFFILGVKYIVRELL